MEVGRVVASEVSNALKSGRFDVGSGAPPNVVRAVLEVVAACCKVGAELAEFANVVRGLEGAPPPVTAGGMRERFQNMVVKTGIDDLVVPLPTTPDKTPAASGGTAMPPLPPTPAVEEGAGGAWDDWDESDDEEDVGGGGGGAGGEGGGVMGVIRAWVAGNKDAAVWEAFVEAGLAM